MRYLNLFGVKLMTYANKKTQNPFVVIKENILDKQLKLYSLNHNCIFEIYGNDEMKYTNDIKL